MLKFVSRFTSTPRVSVNVRRYAQRSLITLTVILLVLLIVVFLSPKTALGPKTDNQKPNQLPKPPTTTLFFAGDIMLSRNVAGKIYTANDVHLPYLNVSEKILSADIAFANLESPFNSQGDHSVQNSLIFNADPKFADGLSNAGFDILSTANNHSFDQGKSAIEFTRVTLVNNNLVSVGTGVDCHSGKIIEKNQIKFGFLAYSYAAHNDGGKIPDPLVCDWNDEQQIVADIQAMRPQVDFLIVSAHIGTEYKRVPDEDNALRARKTIDAGADLFIGHHPHWIQTIEQYQGKWIFYSLGNFVFDQMWSQDTKEGLTITVTLEEKAIKKIELNPVVIENYCCPIWADDMESLAILKKIGLTTRVLLGENK